MSLINLWINALTKSRDTFAAEKSSASLARAAKWYAVIYGLVGLLLGLGAALLASVVPLPQEFAWAKALGIAMIVVLPIVLAVFGVVASLIGAGIIFVFAKLLGGKGVFAQQYYLQAIFAIPISISSLVVNVVPILGQLVSFLLAIYSVYLLTIMLKQVHSLDTLKAVLAWAIPAVIATIFFAAAAGLALLGAGGRFY